MVVCGMTVGMVIRLSFSRWDERHSDNDLHDFIYLMMIMTTCTAGCIMGAFLFFLLSSRGQVLRGGGGRVTTNRAVGLGPSSHDHLWVRHWRGKTTTSAVSLTISTSALLFSFSSHFERKRDRTERED